MNWSSIIRYFLLALATILCFVFYYVTFIWGPKNFPPNLSPYLSILSGLLFGLAIASLTTILQEILRRHPTALKSMMKIRVAKPWFEEISVAFISKSSWLRRQAVDMSVSLQRDVMHSGKPASPYRLIATAIFAAFVSTIICGVLAVYLMLTVNMLFFMILLIPPLLLLYPTAQLKFAVEDRKRNVGDELPMFSLYASILQSVGLSLYNALLSIRGKKVFPEFEKDARISERNVSFFTKTPVESLNDLGRLHPNADAKLFYVGYASEWYSGGDLTAYLESKAKDFLKDMRFKWTKYSQKAGDWGEAIIALLFVAPILVLTSAFVFPGTSLVLLIAFMTMGLPIITAVLYSFISLSQPKARDELEGSAVVSVFVGAVTAIITVGLAQPVWSVLAASIASGLATFALPVIFQMRDVAKEEKSLPAFLRDLTEYKKMGYDIVKGMHNIAKAEPYTEKFNILIKYVTRQLDLGTPLSGAVIPTRSWAVKTSFFILGQIVDSGGGTPRCLELLTDYVDEYIRIKKETKESMVTYRLLAAFTPIGLAFTVNLMYGLVTAFAGMVSPAAAAGVLPISIAIPESFLEINYLLIIVASVSVSLLATKTIEFTSKNTLWITINVILAMLGILISTPLINYMMRSMQGMV
jgi:flagellar protein FlaJ